MKAISETAINKEAVDNAEAFIMAAISPFKNGDDSEDAEMKAGTKWKWGQSVKELSERKKQVKPAASILK